MKIKTLEAAFLKKLGTTVQLKATPLYNHIPSGVRYEMPVLVQIISGTLPESHTREPINLCVVLDRSGSMSGVPMEMCKAAMRNIIDNMEENDVLHLVTFDDTIDVIFENMRVQDKNTMLASLGRFDARGSTDIWAGIKRGLRLLIDSECVGTKLMFLLSDGNANHGVRDGEQIGINTKILSEATNIRICSYGIGTDYNEILLNSIALSGKGKYYYLNTMSVIPEMINIGIDSYTRYWTKDATLTIRGRDTTQIVSIDKWTSILEPRSFTIKESNVLQFMAKAIVLNNTDPGIIEAILSYHYDDDIVITCQAVWEYDDLNLLTLHPVVECYMTVQKCSEINQEIQLMIQQHRDAAIIIRKKEMIISMYENMLEQDEFAIIPALLFRERKVLTDFKTKGVYDAKSLKKFSHNAAMHRGFTNVNTYNYVSDDEDDSSVGDMHGFALFCDDDSDEEEEDESDDY